MGSFERSGEVLDDPMRNRVTPLGEIVSVPLRGAWLGNRGILHEGTDVVRQHRGPLWIICALKHNDWRLPQWQPGHFTVLFFHDEAVALAAGHRPCALCRRSSYDEFREAWVAGNGSAQPLAHDIDRRLHGERLVHRTQRKRLHSMPWSSLPDGAFVKAESQPMLILGDLLVPWRTIGYGFGRPRPRQGYVDVVTPPSTVEVLSAGYRPQIDDRALRQAELATT